MNRSRTRRILPGLLAALLLLGGCTGTPEGVRPVDGFELERYLGRWYEIARLDHSFERGLERVTADYSPRKDGGVRVINRGYRSDGGELSQAEGRAYFVDGPDRGHLKVSFFGPFYGSYIVFELDEAYRHAFVSGPSTDYLWLLARAPTVDKAVLDRFRAQAQSLGFDLSGLILVRQE